MGGKNLQESVRLTGWWPSRWQGSAQQNPPGLNLPGLEGLADAWAALVSFRAVIDYQGTNMVVL